MSRSIFDFIEKTEGSAKKKLPEKENSYVRSAKFGLQETGHNIFKLLNYVGDKVGITATPFGLGGSDKEFNERYGADEVSQDFTNKVVQRASQLAPFAAIPALLAASGGAGIGTVAGIGASALPSIAASGLGGQVVEELGGGPLLQALGELGGGLAIKIPGALSRKLPSNPKAMVDLKRSPIQPNQYNVYPYPAPGVNTSQVLEDTLESITKGTPKPPGSPPVTPLTKASGSSKVPRDQFIDEARALGLSEEEITPLIQSEGKQKWLAKAADKGAKTQERLANSKKAIENIYENITNDPRSATTLRKHAQNTVFNEMNNIINNIPTEAVVGVEKHLKRFMNSNRTGRDLMLLHQDLNNLMSTKDGMKALSHLKDPIRDALASIHPDLGKNFRAANDFMSKYYEIASSLKPTETSKFLSAAKSIGIGKGVIDVITGNGVSGLKNIAGTIAAKSGVEKLSRAMLTNPRFQDLGRKMVLAVKQNKPQAAQAIIKSFAKTAIGEGIDPEIVALIQSGF